MIHVMNNHSGLNSKLGRSVTLLNLASPPLIESKVAEIASFVISPSWSVYLFLLPGFNTTTLSFPSYLNIYPHFFYNWALSHMNLILAPRSIFLSNFALRASNDAVSYLDGFSLVNNITHNVDSVPRQISLALFACISGTKNKLLNYIFLSSTVWWLMNQEKNLLQERKLQNKCSKTRKDFQS